MDLSHQFTVPAPLSTTWETFGDIEGVAECFPGAKVTGVEGDEFTGTCKVKLGPIALTYSGKGSFKEKDEQAHRFVVEAMGKDKRGNGTAGATVTATFTGDESSTTVEVLTDLAITGKPAQFGRGVMQDVSDKLLQQFVSCLAEKVSAPEQTPAADPDAQTSSGPVAAGGAGGAGEAATGSDPGAGEPAGASEAERAEAARPTGPVTPVPVESRTDQGVTASERTTVADLSSASSAASANGTGAGAGAATSRTRAGDNDALDLGATVLPVLAKAYWKQAAAALGVLLALAVLRRLLTRG